MWLLNIFSYIQTTYENDNDLAKKTQNYGIEMQFFVPNIDFSGRLFNSMWEKNENFTVWFMSSKRNKCIYLREIPVFSIPF